MKTTLIQRSIQFLRTKSQLGLDDTFLLIIIAVPVGAFSGLAAVALNFSLKTMHMGLHQYYHSIWGFWFPGAGAAVGYIFFRYLARDSGLHGVPEIIDSICHNGARLRIQSCFSHLVASSLTIGSGGSAGPEAPVVISGAAIGSNMATLLGLNERQRMILLGCGAAGAISAIFNAPVAGILFVLEVLLADWSTKNLVPIAISSVAGNQISDLLLGNVIVFAHRQFDIGTADIMVAFILGIFCSFNSIFFTRSLNEMHRLWRKATLPQWLKVFASGCLVGGVGYFNPVVLGEGYHNIQSLIQADFSSGIFFVCFCLAAKIIATSLTLGGGGSGGIFAPSLAIGALTGVFFQRCLVIWLPMVSWVDEGCFALLGMTGLISGMLQAPLTGIMLIVEITGDYNVILPLIIVAVVSATVCRTIEPASFYLKELVKKGRLHRPRTDERILSDLSIAELLENDCISVSPAMLLRDFFKIVSKSKRNYFPVMEQIMDKSGKVAQIDDNLKTVLQMMEEKQSFSIPVLSEKRFVGMVSKATLLDFYRTELKTQTCS